MARNNKNDKDSPEKIQSILSDKAIEEFVIHEILEQPDRRHVILSKKKIYWKIISQTKCDMNEAEGVLQRMLDLGLKLCQEISYDSEEGTSYDFIKFADLREYRVK
jgi:hypothetical protein